MESILEQDRANIDHPPNVAISLEGDSDDAGHGEIGAGITTEIPFSSGITRPSVGFEHVAGSLLTRFRLRRLIMVVLALAVAVSVVLAAVGSSEFDLGRSQWPVSLLSSSPDLNDGSVSNPSTDIRSEGAAAAMDDLGSRSTGSADGSRPVEPIRIEGHQEAGDGAGPTAGSSATTQASESADTNDGRSTVSTRSTQATSTSSPGTSSSAAAIASSSSPTSTATTPEPTPTSDSTDSTASTASSITIAKSSSSTTTTESTTTTTTAQEARRDPVDVIGNGQFEQPRLSQELQWFDNQQVGAWRSTNGDIQLMQSGFDGIPAASGDQFAEVNSSGPGQLYQEFAVEAGTIIDWTFFHRGRNGNETMQVVISHRGDANVVQTVTTGTSGWSQYAGQYTVPDGVDQVRFGFASSISGPYGNLIDGVVVTAG